MSAPAVSETATASTSRYTAESTNAAAVVEAWHAEVHGGPMFLCLEQPCHAVEAVR